MKVKCIDDRGDVNFPIGPINVRIGLTKGRIYRVDNEKDDCYHIKDDMGRRVALLKSRFIEVLDLEELEQELDRTLDAETTESLIAWLQSRRIKANGGTLVKLQLNNAGHNLTQIENKVNEIIDHINQDNPVASLNKEEIEFLKACLKVGDFTLRFFAKGSFDETKLKNLISKLENARTTDNEQPGGYKINGEHVSYEELVDLLAHYRDSGRNESLTRERAKQILDTLPNSNY